MIPRIFSFRFDEHPPNTMPHTSASLPNMDMMETFEYAIRTHSSPSDVLRLVLDMEPCDKLQTEASTLMYVAEHSTHTQAALNMFESYADQLSPIWRKVPMKDRSLQYVRIFKHEYTNIGKMEMTMCLLSYCPNFVDPALNMYTSRMEFQNAIRYICHCMGLVAPVWLEAFARMLLKYDCFLNNKMILQSVFEQFSYPVTTRLLLALNDAALTKRVLEIRPMALSCAVYSMKLEDIEAFMQRLRNPVQVQHGDDEPPEYRELDSKESKTSPVPSLWTRMCRYMHKK